jgi:AbrB family looped-hinge helix DNA binding protein
MTNKVGDRFQITIDKAIRERLGVRPGDIAIERVEDGLLVVEFLPPIHDRSLRGILRRDAVPSGSTNSAAEKDAAWSARARELAAPATGKSRPPDTPLTG